MSARARRAMGGLVMGAIAFAVVLLIGAGLILRTFTRLLAVDPGFRYDHVMTLDLVLPADRYAADDARRGFFDRAFAAVRAVPGVRDIGAGVVVPLTGNNWTLPFERTDHAGHAGRARPGRRIAGGVVGLLPGARDSARVRTALRGWRQARLAARSHREPGGRAAILRRRERGRRPVQAGRPDGGDRGSGGSIRRAGFADEPRADLYLPFEQAPNAEITLFVRMSAVTGAVAGGNQDRHSGNRARGGGGVDSDDG